MHLLLIEDNPADARLIMEFLAEKEDSPSIQWVTDGYEALDYIYKRGQCANGTRPDVVILDLGLPRVSGYDVLRELKDDAQYATIPIIILTTSRNPLDRSQCHMLGADMFLSKPSNLKGYETLVEQLINIDFPRFTQQLDGYRTVG